MSPAIGYAIPERNSNLSWSDEPQDCGVNAVEIDFESDSSGLRVDRYVDNDRFDLVSIHAMSLAVAGPTTPSIPYLRALKEIAVQNGALAVSDHLLDPRPSGDPAVAPTASSTRVELARICRNIDAVQKHFDNVHFYIESGAGLSPKDGRPWAARRRSMSRAQFLAKILAKTGCGWLLDVASLHADALNCGYDACELIEEVVPSASRVQMHLAGIAFDKSTGLYTASPAHAIPDSVLELCGFVLEMAFSRVDAIFIHRDRAESSQSERKQEIRTVREITEGIAAIA